MIHFVYKVPRHSSLIGRLLDKLSLQTSWFPAPWRSGRHIPWRSPIKAPHSISFHLLEALRRRDTVKFYDLWEQRACPIRPGDKFLGVPIQSSEADTYRDPAVYGCAARTLDTYPSVHKTIIMPYCHDAKYNAATNDFIKAHGQNMILVSNRIWTDTWDQSPIRGYVKNLLRVNMAIDAADYPVVKTSFSPKGRRRFLYVGHTGYYKNTAQLEAIAAAIPGFEGVHIGRGSIKGWKKLSDGADLTPEFMRKVALEYDIFLNTSLADPSPTTILEAMCFGFAVACTPESAYDYDTITPLHTTDTAFNVRAIAALQQMDESELLARARKNREYAVRFHNWDDFTSKVIDFVYNRPTDAAGLFITD